MDLQQIQDDVRAAIDERLAARRAEVIRRGAERKAVRAAFKARRDAGLAARHRRKLNRGERA